MKTAYLKLQVRKLLSIDSKEELLYLLETNEYTADLLIQNPPYNIFNVPKRHGGTRLIEDPTNTLQTIQEKLNDYLQPLYYLNRTNAAYGFILHPKDDDAPRNIVTNAKKHASNDYLLAIDMQDFFHQVCWQMVYDSLCSSPFLIADEVTKYISNLCTYNGRLPMGAPTSPVLSNVAAYQLDKELENYCTGEDLVYTRYVDDMSISSNKPILERHLAQITNITERLRLKLNPYKTKLYGPGEEKLITGLVIKGNEVKVADSFITETEKEIANLKTYVLMLKRMYPNKPIEEMILKPVQKITGALTFIASVHGANYIPVQQLAEKLDEAQVPPSDYESLNWLNIGYISKMT